MLFMIVSIFLMFTMRLFEGKDYLPLRVTFSRYCDMKLLMINFSGLIGVYRKALSYREFIVFSIDIELSEPLKN